MCDCRCHNSKPAIVQQAFGGGVKRAVAYVEQSSELLTRRGFRNSRPNGWSVFVQCPHARSLTDQRGRSNSKTTWWLFDENDEPYHGPDGVEVAWAVREQTKELLAGIAEDAAAMRGADTLRDLDSDVARFVKKHGTAFLERLAEHARTQS